MHRRFLVGNIVLAAVGALLVRDAPVAAQTATPVVDVSGLWMSRYGNGPENRLNLGQAGLFVTGTYTSNVTMPGAMVGRFNGLVLTGRWTDATSTGGFQITFTPNGRAFVGTWGLTPDSPSSGGIWVGRRQ